MIDQRASQHAALIDFQNEAEEIVSKLHSPTKESAENALKAIASPNADTIMSYTGYYPMDVAPGAFLSIDTTEYYYRFSEPITISVAIVSVSISMDGKTSKTYRLDKSTSFDGKTLIIPNVLDITLTRKYEDGILTTFSGVVGKTPVKGMTSFNPIPLSTFSGDYYSLKSKKHVLSVKDSGRPYESSISFDFGSGLQGVRAYSFTPLMFVLAITQPGTADPYTIMLGTASGMGLACYILGAENSGYAFSILP